MRSGRWTAGADYGEGSADNREWPPQPAWFASSADFGNISRGLAKAGFGDDEVEKIMGRNWLTFFEKAFTPEERH